MTETDRLLLRVPEVASALGLSRTVIYELMGKGEFQVVHVGRSVRVVATSLDAWLERQLGTIAATDGESR